MPMDARTDKLIRRTTMIGTVTATYFLLTSDFGSHPNALDPIISEWSSQVRAKRKDGDDSDFEDINKIHFSAIVQIN